MGKFGVISRGIKAPIIREGDDLVNIVVNTVLDATEQYIPGSRPIKGYELSNKDIIGVTESIVARAYGEYVTVDDIAADIEKKYGKDAEICVAMPIYSRNRFSMILKGIARAAKKIVFVMPQYDEVGNPSGINPFTGVNIKEYYKEICESENCEVGEEFKHQMPILNCQLHVVDKTKPSSQIYYYLDEICNDKSPDWGLLGTNKATEEKLKLFPSKKTSQKFVEEVKKQIKETTGKDVIVCVYGDGCFKDPKGGIWEFADPVTMPGYTNPEIMDSTPNEIKIKAFADDKYKNLNGDALTAAVKGEIHEKDANLVGNMASQGTTPRRYADLIASLFDLTSGSGDKGTPIIWLQNYFNNYSND